MTYEMQKLDAAKMAEASRQLSADIQPLLAGRGIELQGAVLGDLVSLWLAGMWPLEMREAMLAGWLKCVRDLVPASEAELFGPEGHPGRQQSENHGSAPGHA